MSKPPPPPPIPGFGSSAAAKGEPAKGGNGQSDASIEELDSGLLEMVSDAEGDEASDTDPRHTVQGVGAVGTPPSQPSQRKARGGAARRPEENTPVREHPEVAPAAREEAPRVDRLAPIVDEKNKKKEKEPQVQKMPLEGRRFGRFELLLEMGSGGMATLYLSRIRGPQNFEKLIAIKKIHDHLSKEDEFVEMFLDEARISAMIHHPHVVQIFDLGSIEGAYFIAMEYVHGQDLSQILRAAIRSRNESFSWAYAARLVADTAAGLHAAHELKDAEDNPIGLVHRDVSPQNILVSYDGHVKVVDFGIAYAAEKISQTGVGTLKGKASYMSPEQSRGQRVDRRSDVFALGILLFESVCLKRLFREENEAATLLRVGAADVPRPRSIRPDVPAELERIILKALAKEPDGRFATAAELQGALEQLLVSKGNVVGPAQLAQLMDELFHDRKRIRDGQIREVAARPTTNVGQAIGMSTTTVTQLDSLHEAEDGPSRRWVKPLVIALVVAAAVALGGVLGLPYLRGGGAADREKGSGDAGAMTPPARRPAMRSMTAVPLRPPPRRREAPEPEKVLLQIKIRPPGAKAQILFRGNEYRQHELELLVTPQDSPEVVRVEAPGYWPLSRHITVNAKTKLKHEFELKRIPRRIRIRRPPRRRPPDDDLKLLPD